MDTEDWPAFLADYQAALEEFERVTETLTLLLVDRTSTPEDFRGVFEAEANARDRVILTRIRLVNAWRETQPGFDLPTTLDAPPTRYAAK